MGFKSTLVIFKVLVSSFFLLAAAANLLVSAQDDSSDTSGKRFRCPSQIYAFGDSYTDTGNLQAAIPATNLNYPYGESYCFPNRPEERTRYSNGRLVIDFITQAFKFPFLEPYLRHSDDGAYRRGANFAISSGTASDFYSVPGTSSLDRQTKDYLDFIANHTGSPFDTPSALLIIPEIGGNDFYLAYTLFGQTPETAAATVVPVILEAVKASLESKFGGVGGLIECLVQRFYASGARNIAVFNIPPEGCSAMFRTTFAGMGEYDKFGCLANYNAANQAYNILLNATIYEYRAKWPGANLFLFDYHAATFEVLTNAEQYGFTRETLASACCGCCGPDNYNPLVPCGTSGLIPDPDGGPDVFVNATQACDDPDRYMIWDGQHTTQAFYRIMAGFFLNGRFVDGPRELSNWKERCNLDFSQWYNNGSGLCNNTTSATESS